jgi:hypothetical protein
VWSCFSNFLPYKSNLCTFYHFSHFPEGNFGPTLANQRAAPPFAYMTILSMAQYHKVRGRCPGLTKENTGRTVDTNGRQQSGSENWEAVVGMNPRCCQWSDCRFPCQILPLIHSNCRVDNGTRRNLTKEILCSRTDTRVSYGRRLGTVEFYSNIRISWTEKGLLIQIEFNCWNSFEVGGVRPTSERGKALAVSCLSAIASRLRTTCDILPRKYSNIQQNSSAVEY